MTLKTFIRDGCGSGHLVGISHAGELIVSGFGTNQTKFNALNVANTAFNFFIPLSGQNFVITSVIYNAPAGTSTVDIYEASSATSTTIVTQIFRIVTVGATFVPLIFSFGGFIPISEGSFLNAKTDNTTINMTIVGFYKIIHEIKL
jgi:hypothetical protein